MRDRFFLILVSRVTVIAVLLSAWEVLGGGFGFSLKVIDVILFSRPSLILLDLFNGFYSGELTEHLLFTLQSTSAGLVLGIVTGVLVGFLFAYNKWLGVVLEPIMSALNSLPRPALGPVLVLIFGLGLASKITLSWSIVFFIVFYNTQMGIASVDPDLIRVARVMGATKLQVFIHVVLPSVFSWVFAALRVSVAFALVGAVVGEFVGSTKGLGYEMEAARGLLNSDRVYAILFILMFIGVFLTSLARLVERRVLNWRPKDLVG